MERGKEQGEPYVRRLRLMLANPTAAFPMSELNVYND